MATKLKRCSCGREPTIYKSNVNERVFWIVDCWSPDDKYVHKATRSTSKKEAIERWNA